ncbi:MAG: S9 family peptidase [Flammeovirgaceae bacterium]|nr:S9 family peptidase [Flammeovirgaceae bacterium]
MRQTFKYLLLIISIALGRDISAQKKILDHSAYDEWTLIKNETISNNGAWITYELTKNSIANPIIVLSTFDGIEKLRTEKGTKPRFSFNSQHLFFTIKPDIDSLNSLKRIKTPKKELPADGLGVFNLKTGELREIPKIISYKIPGKWSNWVSYLQEPLDANQQSKKKNKDTSKENGYDLVIKNLNSLEKFTFPFVTSYLLSEKGGKVAFVSNGDDSLFAAGVYQFNTLSKEIKPIFRSKGIYQSLCWNEIGTLLSFVSNLDTTKVLTPRFSLHLWTEEIDSASTILSVSDDFLQGEYLISQHFENNFSNNGDWLYFGKMPYPILPDTSLLAHEIVNVEVWTYTDSRLFPQQKVEQEKDSKKSFLCAFDLKSNKFISLGSEHIPNILSSNRGDGTHLIGYNDAAYKKSVSWEGPPAPLDLYAIELRSGYSKKIAQNVLGTPKLSPMGNYAYWYEAKDSAWHTYHFDKNIITKITDNRLVPFYLEDHDTPDLPNPYGVMTWTEDDKKILIYDRYDIWEIDPLGVLNPKQITPNGRAQRLSYRYLKLKDEERFVTQNQRLLLHAVDERDKHEALYYMNYNETYDVTTLMSGSYQYRNFSLAQDSDQIIFTKQNFTTFPDLLSTEKFKKIAVISNANPQQKNYNWGTAEIVSWTSLDGIPLEGLLIKPENFDPQKKYPLLVNFYEKSSDGLNRHSIPAPGRSTINYSFYASRGYVIFLPNIHYIEGYPGQSAYNSVIPGVTSLIEKGFIDKDHIGVQGHSWGGYQIAYLVTKTDIFKCAEAGAPVPNMISAYGGIRWWTGLSRMFQYEQTQSRIGGTLWEYPLRYIENSPIFFVDKINTPLLIMHNDADGHVPWYQGIEFFVALRRLNKPAWMLNYQGEPHWPLKLQNQIDFNIRMSQYFDYYLKEAAMPKWMQTGVSALELGIHQNLELIGQ